MSELGYYEKLETAYFASQADQRFGYYLYVPSHFTLETAADYALAVIIHGTGRTPQTYRTLFKDFAEAHDCVILAPLFPAGIIEPGELSNYKFIQFHDIRFDTLLLSMVGEVAQRYGIDGGRFLMHGFSGGGHFAHRFFYLHPERLLGVSIGAPGMVTLLDDSRDWHCGTRGMAELFDRPIDVDAMRGVAVQMVVGGEDTDTWEITIARESRHWMEGVNDAGRTRLDRLEALRDSFLKAGIPVRHDIVPGVGHKGYDLLGPVREFFAEQLQALRAGRVDKLR